MSQQEPASVPENAASPEIKASPRVSLIWLIPILTAVIGGWLVFKTLAEKAPEITIAFKSAEGIEAGKTRIKYRDLDVGTVESLDFSRDFSHVELTAKMHHGTESLLRKGTRFWVVKPRLGLSGVSGLSTLVSGVYIALEPGQGPGSRIFDGLDQPPIILPGEHGKEVTLVSRKLGSLDIGSPVYYRGLQAGEVYGYELSKEKKNVLIYAFIKPPFDKLVRSNSRFWNVGGLDVTLGANGVDVHMESMKSLALGGIAFETPDSLDKGKEELKDKRFTLYDNHRDIEARPFNEGEKIIAYFDRSVRGLSVGAPVEFKGIKVGSVSDLRLEYDPENTSFRIPVLLEVSLNRLGAGQEASSAEMGAFLKRLIDKGLRAQLRMGTLLTGKLFVELDMHPGTPLRLHEQRGSNYPELPTIPGNFDRMATSLQNILAKLEQLDVVGISKDLRASLHSLHSVLDKLDRHAEPVAANVDETLTAAKSTLKLINRQLKSGSSMMQMADEMGETARAIRALVELLERDPNAVIFGKKKTGE